MEIFGGSPLAVRELGPAGADHVRVEEVVIRVQTHLFGVRVPASDLPPLGTAK